jgi:phage tail sheath gpL-like
MGISTAVDASAVARVVGIKTIFKDLRGGSILYLPQRIVVLGQGTTALNGTYSLTKVQVTSAAAAAAIYGFGSPIHLACLQLLPTNGDGVGTIPVTIYPLDDEDSSVVASGDITPSGSQSVGSSYFVLVNNIRSDSFVIAASDTVAVIVTAMTAAINAVSAMPIIATDDTTEVGFTTKWKGVSANDVYVEVFGDFTDVTFAYTQANGGLVNPDADAINAALDQIGDVWESLVLNLLDIADTTVLDTLQTFGDGRWGALTKKPLIAFTGNTNTTVANATAVSDARKADRINSQLVAPGSNDLPFVVAARQLARIAVIANNNPPHDYGSLQATGLTPGLDGEQWSYADRDEAIKKGSSTIEVRDDIVTLSDIVTFYHPTGDPIPAYRYVVDIVKLQTIIFNLNLIFATTEWDGAPLLPDADPTTNRSAKKPRMAKAEIATMLDNLGLDAIISDPKTAKAATLAEINSGNPKRLDVVLTLQLVGNANIISIDLEFGFFFGTSQIVA